ncbi:hypothetical protein J2S05_003703 [Alkalicoccobacillus murimartini]|uniref:Uncharacterized protein n=1 Tax=Alkalicoccobacillus murimartini TaxID=171685 RepID=A0ABT9YLX9_9BACI|nr:hypothetical protein [Alkalicoccobacillus murimartini]
MQSFKPNGTNTDDDLGYGVCFGSGLSHLQRLEGLFI